MAWRCRILGHKRIWRFTWRLCPFCGLYETFGALGGWREDRPTIGRLRGQGFHWHSFRRYTPRAFMQKGGMARQRKDARRRANDMNKGGQLWW